MSDSAQNIQQQSWAFIILVQSLVGKIEMRLATVLLTGTIVVGVLTVGVKSQGDNFERNSATSSATSKASNVNGVRIVKNTIHNTADTTKKDADGIHKSTADTTVLSESDSGSSKKGYSDDAITSDVSIRPMNVDGKEVYDNRINNTVTQNQVNYFDGKTSNRNDDNKKQADETPMQEPDEKLNRSSGDNSSGDEEEKQKENRQSSDGSSDSTGVEQNNLNGKSDIENYQKSDQDSKGSGILSQLTKKTCNKHGIPNQNSDQTSGGNNGHAMENSDGTSEGDLPNLGGMLGNLIEEPSKNKQKVTDQSSNGDDENTTKSSSEETNDKSEENLDKDSQGLSEILGQVLKEPYQNKKKVTDQSSDGNDDNTTKSSSEETNDKSQGNLDKGSQGQSEILGQVLKKPCENKKKVTDQSSDGNNENTTESSSENKNGKSQDILDKSLQGLGGILEQVMKKPSHNQKDVPDQGADGDDRHPTETSPKDENSNTGSQGPDKMPGHERRKPCKKKQGVSDESSDGKDENTTESSSENKNGKSQDILDKSLQGLGGILGQVMKKPSNNQKDVSDQGADGDDRHPTETSPKDENSNTGSQGREKMPGHGRRNPCKQKQRVLDESSDGKDENTTESSSENKNGKSQDILDKSLQGLGGILGQVMKKPSHNQKNVPDQGADGDDRHPTETSPKDENSNTGSQGPDKMPGHGRRKPCKKEQRVPDESSDGQEENTTESSSENKKGKSQDDLDKGSQALGEILGQVLTKPSNNQNDVPDQDADGDERHPTETSPKDENSNTGSQGPDKMPGHERRKPCKKKQGVSDGSSDGQEENTTESSSENKNGKSQDILDKSLQGLGGTLGQVLKKPSQNQKDVPDQGADGDERHPTETSPKDENSNTGSQGPDKMPGHERRKPCKKKQGVSDERSDGKDENTTESSSENKNGKSQDILDKSLQGLGGILGQVMKKPSHNQKDVSDQGADGDDRHPTETSPKDEDSNTGLQGPDKMPGHERRKPCKKKQGVSDQSSDGKDENTTESSSDNKNGKSQDDLDEGSQGLGEILGQVLKKPCKKQKDVSDQGSDGHDRHPTETSPKDENSNTGLQGPDKMPGHERRKPCKKKQGVSDQSSDGKDENTTESSSDNKNGKSQDDLDEGSQGLGEILGQVLKKPCKKQKDAPDQGSDGDDRHPTETSPKDENSNTGSQGPDKMPGHEWRKPCKKKQGVSDQSSDGKDENTTESSSENKNGKSQHDLDKGSQGLGGILGQVLKKPCKNKPGIPNETSDRGSPDRAGLLGNLLKKPCQNKQAVPHQELDQDLSGDAGHSKCSTCMKHEHYHHT